jgi:predicted 3-demethylubiquinone-9 3-methyltransferase (glyoxalase superfamily)
MSKITPCLWFNGNAEEAASFYVSLLPDSRILGIARLAADTPNLSAGAALTVDFTIAGQPMKGLNGGPEFQFNEAISLVIDCEDQAEVDRLWAVLTAGGGSPGQCGWLKDRFGLSWQIVPRRLGEVLGDPDPARAARVMEAMLRMTKIDLDALRRAADGAPVD